MAILLQEITMKEFARQRLSIATAIVPVGALEEHGEHLPLGLDSLHAWELAKAAADLTPCFVAPLVFYGLCRSTSDHPGTISISGQTLQALLQDIGLGLHHQGIRGLCFVSGHAGGTHGARMTEAGEYLLTHTSLEVAVVSVMDLLQEARAFLQCPQDSHAGEMETSLAMALWPQKVKGRPGEAYPEFPGPILTREKVKHWPSGIWGNPALASADKGRRLLASEAKQLAAIVSQLSQRVKEKEAAVSQPG
jgi:creatinine amidohydrolase